MFTIVGIVLTSRNQKIVDRKSGTNTRSEITQPSEKTQANQGPLPTIGGSTGISADSPIANEYAALDPKQNGWTSEAVHNLIYDQMKHLGHLLEHPETLDRIRLKDIVSPDFSSVGLRPNSLQTVFNSDAFTVERPIAENDFSDQTFVRVAGGLKILHDFAEPIKVMNQRRLDVKIFRVSIDADFAVSHASIVLSGIGSNESIQQNATWECRWKLDDQAAPRLVHVNVKDYELVTCRYNSAAPFLDVTEPVLAGNACYREQLAQDLDHWTARIEQGLGMYLDGWCGLAVGDVNNDGLDDLYVCQPGGLPNRLFLHRPDGTAIDAAKEYGVDWLDRSTGALFVDLDNDGRQDLVLAIQGGVLVMQNGADGKFKLRQSIPTSGQPYSLAAADFDSDQMIDVYVCCYNRGARSAQQGGLDVPVPYYDANNGAPNLLLRNLGDFMLSDVSTEVGMGENNQRFSYAAAWEDFDNDGDQDLYVANDFGRNNLYRNDAGRFTDVAAQVGVEDVGSGMSVSWSDYNGDGWMDVYVGNMFSAAGSRITYQRKFSSAFNKDALESVRRLARGNTLFENAGNGAMRDVSAEAGVSLGRWAWSSNFVDINNDGSEDLVVANGFVTGSTDVDL